MRLGKLYAKFVKELSKLGFDIGTLDEHPLFNFDNFPELRERLNEIFFDFVQKNVLVLQDGIKAGTALAFAQDASNLKGYTILNDDAIERVRATATRAYLNYRMGGTHGLSLSDKVWNYAQQTKGEFEMAVSNVITDGLNKGTPAEELSRRVRQQLNDPDMMYRRYHLKVVQSDGSKKDVAKWYWRVIDKDGKVHFVQAPLEEVGTGTYRSARKNAVRLMRTEINASYHHANTERWRLEPFVLGIRIWGSPEHPRPDICDDLWGDYPKEIDFAGFHPQCLCASAPILCSKEELDEIIRRKQNGEDMSLYVSPNKIKDVPDNFKKYIEEHHDSIKGQFERGTANWFFRDNTKFFASQFSEEERKAMGITLPPQKTKRIKTEEEKRLIQQRWDERRKQNALTIKTYENVLKVASQYPEVDTSLLQSLAGKYDLAQLRLETKNVAHQIVTVRKQHELIGKTALNVIKVAGQFMEVSTANLQTLIAAKDFAAISTETKAVAKQIAALQNEAKAMSDIIPDAKGWMKQFSASDLQKVKKAVEDNIVKWSDKYAVDSYLQSKYASLEDYLTYKLGEEVKYVTDATYLKPHTLYPTSKVAEGAYMKQIAIVQHKIEMKALAADIADIKKWSLAHPNSKKVASLLDDAEQLYAADNDIVTLKQKIADAQKVIDKRNKEQLLRDKKKGNIPSASSQFGDDAYTQKRKDAAMWAKNTKDADDRLRDKCGEVWRAASAKEKDAIFGYTESYSNINEPLRGLTYIGTAAKTKQGLDRIPLIESIINKSVYDFDMWLQRGDTMIALKKFGLKNFATATDAEIYALKGKEGVEGAYWSAGVAKGMGFSSKPVIFNIYAPRGTKAMYCEPFSRYGNGAGRSWDGFVKQTSFGTESEILIQRGTKFRITKVEKSGGKWYIDVEIIEQNPVPFPYVGGYPFL